MRKLRELIERGQKKKMQEWRFPRVLETKGVGIIIRFMIEWGAKVPMADTITSEPMHGDEEWGRDW